ncbi:hypothetical protein ACL7TT_11390 [Microbulbifer sp. 2304DJ12-6]|uniref:hypothetical protein n=1 Tax=Microbulbifer sp. 2304DJ12-6 TaxID=3233340 RepID=UPI0039B05107
MKGGVTIFLLFMTSTICIAEPNLDWDWMVTVSNTQHRDSVWFEPHSESQTQQLEGLISVQANWQDWSGLLAVKGNQIASSEQAQTFDADFIVQELFWQGEWNMGASPVELTLGKLRLDWGVGYGYRPLNFFNSYRRNPVGIQVEEGVGVAMASYFDRSGEWSLLYSDSNWMVLDSTEPKQGSEQQGAGIRRYSLRGDTEWQGIVYYDTVRHGLIAGSMVSVINAFWEVHASSLYQQDYRAYQQQAFFTPVAVETQRDGFQGLIGLNWANEAGNQVIVEYWYDSRAWSKDAWIQALERANILSQQTTTVSLAYSYAQGLNQVNLVQHNVMLHWNLNSTSWRHWQWSKDILWVGNLEPKFDLLYSPEDGGIIATQWLNYSTYDSGTVSMDIELAVRFMTGSHASVYANLADTRMIFINLKGKF